MLPRALLISGFLLTVFSACHHSSEDAVLTTEGELPAQPLDVSEVLSSQSAESTSWRLVGAVYADRYQAGHLEPTEGRGVLAHLPDDTPQSALVMPWEHGDLDLSLDFMLAKGASATLFLQGRYGLQLVDRWGKDSPESGGCGSVGQHPPLAEAGRAPGLWQHLDIKFRAPRFNAQGQKTANARFTEVILNGTVVQKEQEVAAPTAGAPQRKEVPQAPLSVSGGDSPVALKNLTYKTYQRDSIRLQNLQYTLYAGTYDSPAALEGATPVKQEATDSLSYQLKEDHEQFALVVEGALQVPADGEYLFTLRTAGPSWLYVDGEEATNNQRAEYMDTPGYYRATLEAGEHPFRLVYTKSVLKWVNGLSLYAEGPQVRRQPLHAHGAERYPEEPPPLLVRSEDQVLMQRGFFYHGDQKKTHCVLVGLPSKINYAVDIKSGTLLSAWGGDFIDVTQMWHKRGEPQTARPLGNALELSARPAFASLANQTADWPDSVSFDDPYLQTRGYTLDTAGSPVFQYQLGGTQISDRLAPGGEARSLVRKISCSFTGAGTDPVYCLLGEGEQVKALPDGSYGIDGKRYYLTVDSAEATVRKRIDRGREQLVAALSPQRGTAALEYTIIW